MISAMRFKVMEKIIEGLMMALGVTLAAMTTLLLGM